MSEYAGIWAALERYLPDAVELRRDIHREPDLSGDESMTRDLVLAALLPATSTAKVAETGAVVRIGPAGPSIGIRGELDALPVAEASGVPWTSVRAGAMHACGHDVHLAALVAVARALADAGPPVPLLVVLQPREETYPSGARDIVGHGILDTEQCTAMIGVHVQPILEPGEVACVPGGVNASSDEFEITVHGASGHAAYPHLTSDALLAMSEIVVACQSIVSRSVDPMAPAVVGVSSISAGSAANVIAGRARATGTIRALTPPTRALLHERIANVAEYIARAHSCTASVTITHGEPVLENDPTLVSDITRQLRQRDVRVRNDLRSLGADDFSYFSERLPSTMLFVGTDGSALLHSPTFLPSDEDVRRTAEAMLCGYLGAVSAVRGSGRAAAADPLA